jgi:hypothetical protein
MRSAYIFWLESWKGRDHSENLEVDGRTIFKLMLGKYGEMVWTGLTWLRRGIGGGLL